MTASDITNSLTQDGNTSGESWQQYVAHLSADPETMRPVLPLRALAEDFTLRALALLFPQFAREKDAGQRDLLREARQFEQLLEHALTIVVPADRVRDIQMAFLDSMSNVHYLLVDDATAILAGDPAAESLDEVIQAYPGFLATAVHRVAHELYRLGVPIMPRIVSEWVHRETGIDIHPGAVIGHSFAMDHGTGVVIGESSVIGSGVRIYQGVTLGALAVNKKLAHKKRHPTIGDNVIVYANATILGGATEVGEGSIIGGNVWLTHSVPARSIVQFSSNVEQRSADDDGMEFHI